MRPLAVYVHIPFCTVKCGYCDFNAYAGLDPLKGAYHAALLAEIAGWADVLAGRSIASVSFGGGTPGESPAEDIGAVVAMVARFGLLTPDAEVSLEANPGTTTLPYLQGLRAAGLNRISFGAQSFDPAELRFLDRIHSPEATAASVALARAAGFRNVSLDLIYGLPDQAPASWEASLRAAIALQPDHISCYALTVEEGTPLARDVAAGRVQPLDGDEVATMYECAVRLLADAGFEQYEISNWARPGHESRHNRTYWTDGEYLGLGAGAHGYLGGVRYENIAHPRTYIEAVTRQGPQIAGAVRPKVAEAYMPSRRIAMFDWLETAFRLLDGFELAAFEARFGVSVAEVAGPALDRCREAGLVEYAGDRVRLTRRGLLLHSEVLATILAELPE